MKQGDFTLMAPYYINRPAYSTMLLEKLLACVNEQKLDMKDFCITEVGAGTGKMTKLLSNFGAKVFAIEPNDAMREEGIKYTKNCPIIWQKGSGEETKAPSDSAHWLVMASSFHWTNPKLSLPEFKRVLKKGGYFSAIWNPRNIKPGSIYEEIEHEIFNIIPELKRVSSGSQNTKDWSEVLISTGDFCDCFFMECDYVEMMDKERYMGAWRSVNDIQAQAGHKRWQEILEMIERKIAHLKIIEMPYKIRAWSAKSTK